MTSAAPLAVFRMLFGGVMLVSIIRFWALGWIDKLYIQPKFFFSYDGFGWVKPLGEFTYVLFFLCGLSVLFVAIGFRYRWAIVCFFLSFTYIELMDKTTYLNHYYFVSVMSFLLIFLPCGHVCSVDTARGTSPAYSFVCRWHIDAIKLLLSIVYFYAGLAKLNSDWLINAMPLKIWLPTATPLPYLAGLFQEEWGIYVLTWAGALYDLSIPFLLFWRKTRVWAFVFVVVFHLLTAYLFPIGMFPYIMILSTMIFFDARFHERVIAGIRRGLGIRTEEVKLKKRRKAPNFPFAQWVLILFFAIQLLFPFRYLLYPGELFWTEEGYRFSWRVMLMEKAGYAQFKVVDRKTDHWFYVDNSEFLTSFQEKQMAMQPDFILEYAHFLARHFAAQGYQNVGIFVDSFVALNGRRSARYIDPKVDLTQVRDSWGHKTWILPFGDTIGGI